MSKEMESDYEFALRLHAEINGVNSEVNGNNSSINSGLAEVPAARPGTVISAHIPAARPGTVILAHIPAGNSVVIENMVDNDPDEEITVVNGAGAPLQANPNDSVIFVSVSRAETMGQRDRSRSPIQGVSYENQQAITTKREKTSPEDYYMSFLHTYLDLNNNQEWAVVSMESNVQQMFDKLKIQFWNKWLSKTKFTVKWDTGNVISDRCSFKIFEEQKQILISTDAIVRPRIQLVSVLIHVLIHVYLKTVSKGAIKINMHDDNFRKIMLHFNTVLNTKISTFHKFIYSPDEVDYPCQWYHCTGICQAYEPFHGNIRCSMIPNESHYFWKQHEEDCGGQFFKVLEMKRTSPSTGEEEKKYVRNVRYMFPKPRCAEGNGKNRIRTVNQVRELFDLTEDQEETPVVQNLCDIINLDDTDYNLPETVASPSTNLADQLVKEVGLTIEKCPFCEKPITTSLFASHVDSCRGHQQKVVYKSKRKA